MKVVSEKVRDGLAGRGWGVRGRVGGTTARVVVGGVGARADRVKWLTDGVLHVWSGFCFANVSRHVGEVACNGIRCGRMREEREREGQGEGERLNGERACKWEKGESRWGGRKGECAWE